MSIIDDIDLLENNHVPPPRRGRVILFTLGGIMVSGVLLAGFVAAYTTVYKEKVYPGVSVGGYDLGGLNASEVKNIAETANNRYVKEGIRLFFKDEQNRVQQVTLPTLGGGAEGTVESISIDSDTLANDALLVGRTGTTWQNLWRPLYIRFFAPVELVAATLVQDVPLVDSIHSTLKPYVNSGSNAEVSFVLGTRLPRVTPEKDGYSFDDTEVIQALKSSLGHISFMPVQLTLKSFVPNISTADVQTIVPKINQILGTGLSFNYVNNETKAQEDWTIGPNDLAGMLEIVKNSDGITIFTLKEVPVKKFITKTIASKIDLEAAEAKFAVTEGKVEEFQPSRNGLKVDVDETFNQIKTAFESRNYSDDQVIHTVSVVVKIVEPTVKTAEINGLGITEIVGAGTSTFKDSHTNRIKNIANAVKRLNGLLIKPGEVFSANKSAGPFIAENGFLPEQVIKGDEIKPEIGGGMCQIGTTLFRMAMQSGMPITERRNHSLVVSYYADPINHNPGTDATLYEPSLDFKFTNDTGNYLLLQTAIDYKKQLLTFTLWGTNDGRSGGYSRPIVKKWIPAGEPRTVYTDDPTKVLPGQTKCQAAFTGANATFTYTRFTSSSEKIVQVFDSYYRPLPKICMVGLPAGSCAGMKTCIPPPGFVTSTAPTAL